MSLAIFYTGDVRYNQRLRHQNHQKLFDKLGTMVQYKIYEFTRGDPNRGICPYDPPGGLEPDTSYRRGQGGAVQVWDFLRGVERTQEPIVMRLRTDLWFTDSSINIIHRELEELLAQRSDISYFGSDWLNENAGAVDKRLEINFDTDTSIQDFVVLAKRECLKSFDQTIEHINKVNPNKRRSGNKMFRYIIPVLEQEHGRIQHARVFRNLCQIWLVRQNYGIDPGDMIVCRDYIQSYIADDKAKMGKKGLQFPHPMQAAVDWWRQAQGMEPKFIEKDRWTEWQLP